MSALTTSERWDTAALIGDACLFSAVAVPIGPLALVIGPAAAWLLHGHRVDGSAVIGWLVGLAAAVAVIGGFFVVGVPLIGTALGSAANEDYSGPIAMLVTAGVVFLAVVVALGVAAIRDLVPSRRRHARLDVVRLAVIAVLVVGAIGVTIAQTMNPAGEAGEAGVFALASGAAGALVALVAGGVDAWWKKRTHAAVPGVPAT
jgi:hypothetical protein